MKVKLTMATYNDAFYGPGGVNAEVARILREAADTIASTDPIDQYGMSFPLIDANGNTVGHAILDEEED